MVELVVGLERKPRNILDMPLERTHPALFRDHHRAGLALHKGFLDRGEIVLGRVGEHRATLAEWRLRPEKVAHFPYLLADLGPLLGLGREQRLETLQLAAK